MSMEDIEAPDSVLNALGITQLEYNVIVQSGYCVQVDVNACSSYVNASIILPNSVNLPSLSGTHMGTGGVDVTDSVLKMIHSFRQYYNNME